MLPPPPSPPLNSLIMHDLDPNMREKEHPVCCLKFGALLLFCGATAVAVFKRTFLLKRPVNTDYVLC